MGVAEDVGVVVGAGVARSGRQSDDVMFIFAVSCCGHQLFWRVYFSRRAKGRGWSGATPSAVYRGWRGLKTQF